MRVWGPIPVAQGLDRFTIATSWSVFSGAILTLLFAAQRLQQVGAFAQMLQAVQLLSEKA